LCSFTISSQNDCQNEWLGLVWGLLKAAFLYIHRYVIHFLDQVDDLIPEKYASALSKLVFAWLDPLVIKGWKKQLDRTDLWSLQIDNR